MIRLSLRTAAASLLIALSVFASGHASAADAPTALRPVPLSIDERAVRAAGIQLSPIQPESGATDLSFPGMVAVPPQQIRVVAAPAAGLIETVLVAPDETVRQGQVIATMRSPELIEAQRGFLTAIADESLAQDRLRRSRSLHESRVIPERDLRVAETEATNAAAKLDEQIQLLKLIGMADEGVETLRRTRRLMASIEMRAPIDGVVTIRHASAGERVVASAPIFTIADLSPLWVNIQVPATRLGALQVGSRVILPTQGAQGRVIRIGRTVDAATQSVAVVAEVDTNGGSVRPGLAVNVSVRVEQNGLAQWLAPSSGVVRHRDRTWVFTRSASGFLAVPVQVVAETARGVAFRADLAPGTEIATRGLLALVAELSETGEE
ncbi:efflux RND transporter periplasmic adaptor subunit [Phreatobacter oligotrophus]|uniref:efflux RND transporter periplasmic adaptor subunit n=1 Tax=Phreatobacter oligotrophus TaxID=1122261 RepID=UPI00235623C6|nr:efflux RND transporter periplasmic adaptor subunit [Phreatobacter oligotrophus]MBX9993095.1 efflux RND transporter periplasmic adaptor subunit [Phreatobacter oligotrophus]